MGSKLLARFMQGNGSIMRFAPSCLLARALKRPEIIHEVLILLSTASFGRLEYGIIRAEEAYQQGRKIETWV